MGKTLALPGMSGHLQTSGWIRQVHSHWYGGPSTRSRGSPFSLSVGDPGRLLRGGGSGVEASRKLGRGRGQRKARKVWGPQAHLLPPTAAEPASCPPGSCPSPPPSPLLCITQHLSRRCHNRLWQQSPGKTWGRARRSGCPTLGSARVTLSPGRVWARESVAAAWPVVKGPSQLFPWATWGKEEHWTGSPNVEFCSLTHL